MVSFMPKAGFISHSKWKDNINIKKDLPHLIPRIVLSVDNLAWLHRKVRKNYSWSPGPNTSFLDE